MALDKILGRRGGIHPKYLRITVMVVIKYIFYHPTKSNLIDTKLLHQELLWANLWNAGNIFGYLPRSAIESSL